MDHLPVPKDPIKPDIEVPYLCKAPYDNQGFDNYPQRMGYELDDAGYVQMRNPDEDLLAFTRLGSTLA